VSRRTRAYLFILAATAIWGVAVVVIKFTLGGISPIDFLVYRFTISGLLSGLFLIASHKHIRKPAWTVPRAALHGILAFPIALTALFIGLDSSTALELSLISTLGPLMVLIGGALFFKEHVTKHEKLGAAVAFSGTLITVLSPILYGSEGRLTGNLLIFAFLFLDTSQVLVAKRLLRSKVHPFVLANIGLLASGLLYLGAYSALFGFGTFLDVLVALEPQYHFGVWYMAIFAGVLANIFFLRGARTIEIGEVGLFAYLGPLFSVPLAVLWLGEQVTLPFVLGAAIITAGVFIAEKRRSR